MMHGTVSIPWNVFEAAALNFKTHSSACCAIFVAQMPRDQVKVLEDCCKRISDIVDLRECLQSDVPIDTVPLLSLLQKFRDRHASDPRDKVYALLSLVRFHPTYSTNIVSRYPYRTELRSFPLEMRESRGMLPDYSLTDVETFGLATLQCICEKGSLSVLSTELGRKFRDDLPSWVPEWSAPGGFTYRLRAAAVELYQATVLEKDPMNMISSTGSVLGVQGIKFDTFVRAGQVMWDFEFASVCRSTLSDWRDKSHKFHGNGSSNRRKKGFRSFWKVICGDIVYPEDTTCKSRRTTPADELIFISWAMESARSPFKVGSLHPSTDHHVGVTAWSRQALAWEILLRRWDRQPVLEPGYIEMNKTTALLVPLMFRHLGKPWLMWHHDFTILLAFAQEHDSSREWMKSRFIQDGLPWDALLLKVRDRFIDIYGNSVNFDPDSKRRLIPTADTSINAATLGRRLVVGLDYLGLGPAEARVGDVMVLLRGGVTPFVLRPGSRHTKEHTYEIVGDAYIHDMMDGQNISKGRIGHPPWNTFSLL